MDNQLNVTFTRMDQDLVSELDRQITERMDDDLDSDVLHKFQYLIMSHDVAWDHLEQQQREIGDLNFQNEEWANGCDELRKQIESKDSLLAEKEKEIAWLRQDRESLENRLQHYTAAATLGDSVATMSATPQKNGEMFYAVRFDNGKYYTAWGFRATDKKESENIEDATLYNLDWMIPRDLYLQQYLFGKEMRYEVVKVKVTKSYEILAEEEVSTDAQDAPDTDSR